MTKHTDRLAEAREAVRLASSGATRLRRVLSSLSQESIAVEVAIERAERLLRSDRTRTKRGRDGR
jgi:hypothetical protein